MPTWSCPIGRIRLSPEDSAQGMRARINRLVAPTIEMAGQVLEQAPRMVVDQGCGRLRHFHLLAKSCSELVLVDTERQLSRRQMIGSSRQTIRDAVGAGSVHLARVRVLNTDEFTKSRLEADLVVSVNVFDVIPPLARAAALTSAAVNLRVGGLYAVIVPRNDTSITSRCRPDNRYADGHVFRRGSTATFYRNFADYRSLVRRMERSGLDVIHDGSSHRYVWLLLRKQAPAH